ncbi:MAG: 4-carboxy-4-hydroxy-2-oxoadipate aldolase/oxaloacetate decarboxylase [Candidatus Atribacteria bacterium]|nr:4-carboxy-4-hydroxy-2-oxoadipate aldolase/oxaloacetate decarboxylase [Candidatus Atribacteria bacterium]
MIHVITNIRRTSEEIIKQYKNIPVATVYEASGRKGFIDSKIKPLNKGMKICGIAFTVQSAPGDNLMLHKALEISQKDDVVVATVGNEYEYGYWGDLMATQALVKGLTGLAIDGCVRDSEEIIKKGFNVFCRGTSIRGTTKGVLGLINYPIHFGGTTVNPGDLILGDDDGMVVVQYEESEEVLKKSLDRIKKEEAKSLALKNGITSVQYNRLNEIFASLNLKED